MTPLDAVMDRSQVRLIATQCRDEVCAGRSDDAVVLLRPLVAARTPFPLLDLAGAILAPAAGAQPMHFHWLLDALAATRAIGAWPLIGSALAAAYLPDAIGQAFAEARRYILLADVWDATDAIAERVLGERLRADFDAAITLLLAWRGDPIPWLRRAVGVATHRYVKRERDEPTRVGQLLELLGPLLDERDRAAIKGIGWGLKTIGRCYPDLLVGWLSA